MSLVNTLFVGVCGGSASGKTTICNELKAYFSDDIQVISQDSYYIDRSHLTEEEMRGVNFDHPESIDSHQLYKDISALKEKKEVSIPQYCFKTHSILKDRNILKVKKVNIVEGLFVFREEPLRKLFDMKIYINADADIRLVRRVKRDIEHRGRGVSAVLEQYLETVKPMHDKFVAHQIKFADYVINTTSSENAIDDTESLVKKIKSLMR